MPNAAGDAAPLRDRGAGLAARGGPDDPPPAAAGAAAGAALRGRAGLAAVELGAELADGIMPTVLDGGAGRASKAWAARGRAKAPGLGPLDVTLGLPTFIGDDLDALRDAARQNLVLYTGLPSSSGCSGPAASPRKPR